jgi:hypothetical protein
MRGASIRDRTIYNPVWQGADAVPDSRIILVDDVVRMEERKEKHDV